MRDLENWEKDIKQKDMELRRQNGVPEEVNFLIKFPLQHPGKLFFLFIYFKVKADVFKMFCGNAN